MLTDYIVRTLTQDYEVTSMASLSELMDVLEKHGLYTTQRNGKATCIPFHAITRVDVKG